MQTDIQAIYQRRLLQLTGLAETALVLIGLKSWYEGAMLDATILLITSLVMLSVFVLVRFNKQTLASITFLAILTAMVLLFHWTLGGIKDNSQLALAGILAFAAMIGAIRIYNFILIFLVANIIAMGLLFERGFEFREPQLGMSSAINIAIILFIVGVTIRLVIRDNMLLLKELDIKIKDVSKAKDVVEHQATHDFLTRLPNRILAKEHFSQLMARLHQQPGSKAGLLYIDFDEFKDINDTLGHGIGDEFLLSKAKLLKSSMRGNDLVCRIGGDEFLILVEDINEGQLSQLAHKILSLIQREETIHGNKLHCTSSIGIVVLPDDASDYEQAVQRADIAMYRSKSDGKDRFHYYHSEMGLSVQRRYQLQNRMLSSLLEDEFQVALQPIVDIKTNRIVGAEALARWQHPVFGAISPMEFVPIAESSGFIDDVCAFVLDQVCAMLQQVVTDHPDFYVSINVSPSQLKNASFFSECISIIGKYNISPHHLKIEITESQIIDSTPEFTQNVDLLHKNGIGLYLDDFGTGYSNLMHLQKMKFETIKIDRSFISHCHREMDTRTLLKSIKAMAEQLQVSVVAEGIEEQQELDEVSKLGIEKGQGYFWSKPIPIDDFIKQFLQASANIGN